MENKNINPQDQVKQIPSNMKRCSECGSVISKKATVCPNCGAKNKKPFYKSGWFIAIIALVAIIIVIAVASTAGNDANADNSETTAAQESVVTQSKGDNSTLGDYKVEIKGCALTKDYDGSNVVLVTFSFTNNSQKEAAFGYTLNDKVFQNGVECEKSYTYGLVKDGKYDDSGNQYKEIKPGTTIEVEVPYQVNDTSSPVEVEVSEIISFNDEKITKTFDF